MTLKIMKAYMILATFKSIIACLVVILINYTLLLLLLILIAMSNLILNVAVSSLIM